MHRKLQRSVKTNDVKGYTTAFQSVLGVHSGLNRSNYARWETLFLEKLLNLDPKFLDIFEKGVFSVRQTTKNYFKASVILSLEQTVNRDFALASKSIVF